MNEAKIPTIIGLIVLILGVAMAVFLVQTRQVFRLGASPEEAPKDVRITNITDSSFNVSWVTDNKNSGVLQWGLSEGDLSNSEKDEVGENSLTHNITLVGLKSDTQYFFKIGTSGGTFDNNGIPWSTRTKAGSAKKTNPVIVSGSVITATGQPAKFSLIYVTTSGVDPLSTISSENGNWVIPIFAPIGKKALLEISVNAGNAVASAQIYLGSANPVPPIILGQVHDFKNVPENTPEKLPTSSIDVPESQKTSRFAVSEDKNQAASNKDITLDSIKQGETVTTANPEFFGKGPKGTTISITLQSETVQAQVKITNSGTWAWTPPNNLSSGSHKITISWVDTSGITRTLTRVFTVQASEGPAFVASQSATLTPSPTPTPKISPTPSITATPTVQATLAPKYDSGSLTPTIVLTIIGIVTFIFSLVIWNYSKV